MNWRPKIRSSMILLVFHFALMTLLFSTHYRLLYRSRRYGNIYRGGHGYTHLGSYTHNVSAAVFTSPPQVPFVILSNLLGIPYFTLHLNHVGRLLSFCCPCLVGISNQLHFTFVTVVETETKDLTHNLLDISAKCPGGKFSLDFWDL